MIEPTPGPWKFALIDADPNEAFVQWKSGFAAVHGSRAGREANARLISSAPELLEFARWFLEHRDGHGREMAQKAVDKALGQ